MKDTKRPFKEVREDLKRYEKGVPSKKMQSHSEKKGEQKEKKNAKLAHHEKKIKS